MLSYFWFGLVFHERAHKVLSTSVCRLKEALWPSHCLQTANRRDGTGQWGRASALASGKTWLRGLASPPKLQHSLLNLTKLLYPHVKCLSFHKIKQDNVLNSLIIARNEVMGAVIIRLAQNEKQTFKLQVRLELMGFSPPEIIYVFIVIMFLKNQWFPNLFIWTLIREMWVLLWHSGLNWFTFAFTIHFLVSFTTALLEHCY